VARVTGKTDFVLYLRPPAPLVHRRLPWRCGDLRFAPLLNGAMGSVMRYVSELLSDVLQRQCELWIFILIFGDFDLLYALIQSDIVARLFR
jgi:hypothetical protein